MNDLARVMQKHYVPQSEYEQILRFLGWLNNFQYTKSAYDPSTFLSEDLLKRMAKILAGTDKSE